jgi:hypothetical protein
MDLYTEHKEILCIRHLTFLTKNIKKQTVHCIKSLLAGAERTPVTFSKSEHSKFNSRVKKTMAV